MIPDRGRALRETLKAALDAKVVEDQGLPKSVPWGPHVYVPGTKQAWHVLTETPDGDAWLSRMRSAVATVSGLRLGVAGTLDTLKSPHIIKAVDELECAVLPVVETDFGYRSLGLRASVADVIYEHRLVLEPLLARELLERCLTRAAKAQGTYNKGATLELLVALMLSQVTGFEVTDKNILSRNQEVDVHATNRNIAGPLGRGQFVLAECKNWKDPVPRKEYNAFASKLRTRHGMAKLGVMVTTSTFESGVYDETLRESERDDVVALLDKDSLPKVWRDWPDVTRGMENAVKNAVYDHEPD